MQCADREKISLNQKTIPMSPHFFHVLFLVSCCVPTQNISNCVQYCELILNWWWPTIIQIWFLKSQQYSWQDLEGAGWSGRTCRFSSDIIRQVFLEVNRNFGKARQLHRKNRLIHEEEDFSFSYWRTDKLWYIFPLRIQLTFIFPSSCIMNRERKEENCIST